VKPARLGSILASSARIGLDTSILIYHFEGNPRYTPLTSSIFAAVAGGLEAVLSALAVMEILVKPMKDDQARLARAIADRLRSMPNFTFVPADFGIAVEAARLRARYSLRPPDALHLATSLLAGVDAFITNDADFRKVAGKEDSRIIHLDDLEQDIPGR
jgi:predicted nucleic acid-binding protein